MVRFKQLINIFVFLIPTLLAFGVNEINAQKIFPGAMGFGTDSRGAYSGSSTPTILYVDVLDAGSVQTSSNSGSFEWCISRDYPRIVLFKVGGIIDYSRTSTRRISIRDPYISIYGQTAPSPGVTIFSCGLYVEDHDVLIQHLKIRYGDYPLPSGDVDIRDCIAVMENAENVVVDHCSISWSQDEIISCYAPNTTFSNNLIYDPLHYASHADEAGEHNPETHGYGPLVPMYEANFSFIRNFLGWTYYRNPAYDAVTLTHLNNFLYSYGYHGPHINGGKGATRALFVGNVNFPTEGRLGNSAAEYCCRLLSSMPTDSRMYFHDNLCIRQQNGYSDIDCVNSSDLSSTQRSSILVSDPASTGLNIDDYEILPSSEVEQYVYDEVGAFYWDRDEYDINALNRLKNRTDDYTNSPADLPARAYNFSIYEGWKSTVGNMEDGYDFSSDPISFSVNGNTITLNSNLTSESAVLNAINNQLPSGTEAIDHPHELSHHIIIQTTSTGSDATMTVSGDDLRVFGIYPGTYHGSDGYIGYPEAVETTHDLNPPSNPHDDDDGNGYTNLEDWIFNNNCSLSLSSEILNTEKGFENGSITLTISGATDPTSFLWSDDNSTDQNRDNLGEGSYTVTVTDANECEISKTFEVEEDSIYIENIDVTSGIITTYFNATNSCTTASINIDDINGASIYTTSDDVESGYSIDLSNICPDCENETYNLTISCGNLNDSESLSYTSSLINNVIADPCSDFSLSENIVNEDSGQSNGSIVITITGGTEPYIYSWDDGSSSKDLTEIQAGTYSLTVTDDNNCTISESFVVEENAIEITGVNLTDGIITATYSTSGDCSNVTYSLIYNDNIVIGPVSNAQSGFTINIPEECSSCTEGTYYLELSCENVSAQQSIDYIPTTSTDPCQGFAIDGYITNSDYGMDNGSITIITEGGTEPFSYLWNDNTSDGDRTNLASGTYTVSVTDANNCSISRSFAVKENRIEISDIQVDNGVITTNYTTTGECTNITYILFDQSNNVIYSPSTYVQTNFTINVPNVCSNCTDGTYSLELSCGDISDTRTFSYISTVDPCESFEVSGEKTDTEYNQDVGTITLSINGGTEPYTFSWNDDNESQNRDNLSEGNYTVEITDSNGCNEQLSFTIDTKAIPLEVLKYYPNPTSGLVAIEYTSPTASTIEIIVESKSGEYINSFTESCEIGTNKLTIDISVDEDGNVNSNGPYNVTIRQGDSETVIELIKKK